MYKLCFHNVWYDFLDFLKENKWKLLASLCFLLLGVILGIRNACGIKDAYGYLCSHNSCVVNMIVGKGSAFGFFFWHLLLFLLMTAVIVLLSFNFFASFMGYFILFLYSYIFALYVALLVIVFRGGFAAALLFGLLPSFIIGFVLLSLTLTLSINRGRDLKIYGFSSCKTFPHFLKALIPALVIGAAICLVEAILIYFLTLGLFV